MSKKVMLLALAAVSAAMFALPAMASAATWDLNAAPAGKFTVTTSTSPVLSNTAGEKVECTSSTGSGAYTSATSGTLNLVFHGCKTPSFFNATCTSGATSGTIETTTELPFSNVYLDKAHTKLGVTIKGKGEEEHFASFTCAGFISFKVTGTILGEVEKTCTSPSTTQFPLNFSQTSNGHQTWKQVEEAGAIEDLVVDNRLNGTTSTGAEVGTGFVNFGAEKTIQCT
jgi:hypothetical protein